MRLFLGCAVLACSLAAAAPVARADTGSGSDCHVGSYRLSDGSLIDIASAGDGLLRWRAFSGETGRLRQRPDGSWASSNGWTDRPDGKTVAYSACATGATPRA